MTALAANKDTKIKDGEELAVPVKAATKIYSGAAVCTQNADGYAVPASDTAGLTRSGIAKGPADNTSGAAAAIDVVVQRKKLVQFKYASTAPTKGQTVNFADDQTVQVTTTNSIKAGIVVEVDASTTTCWVDMGL